MAGDEGHDERDLTEDRQPRDVHHILKEIFVLSIKTNKVSLSNGNPFKRVEIVSFCG